MPTDATTRLENPRNEDRPAPTTSGRRFRSLHQGIALLTLTGLVVRLTIKDHFPLFSTVYYATPVLLLMLGAVWCAVWALATPGRRFAAEWSLLAVVLALWCYSATWRHKVPVTAEPDDLKVLFWNVARHDDLTAAAAYIRRADPDIVGLVEVKGSARDRREFWSNALPGYDISILGGGMQLLTKGSAGDATAHQLHGNSECRELEVTVGERQLVCLVVDIESDVFRSRRTALEQLAVRSALYHDSPVLIMGDFNTPADSVHFAVLQGAHRQMFEFCGQGYSGTWPVPLPVLQLDQIWLNDKAQGISCAHGWSWASDHRPVHAVVRVPKSSEP